MVLKCFYEVKDDELHRLTMDVTSYCTILTWLPPFLMVTIMSQLHLNCKNASHHTEWWSSNFRSWNIKFSTMWYRIRPSTYSRLTLYGMQSNFRITDFKGTSKKSGMEQVSYIGNTGNDFTFFHSSPLAIMEVTPNNHWWMKNNVFMYHCLSTNSCKISGWACSFHFSSNLKKLWEKVW